jgi:hypothetical protein
VFCEFEDNRSGEIDLLAFQNYGGVFSRLSDEGFAKQLRVVDGILTWGEGEIDIAPETVYHLATGLPLPEWMEMG